MADNDQDKILDVIDQIKTIQNKRQGFLSSLLGGFRVGRVKTTVPKIQPKNNTIEVPLDLRSENQQAPAADTNDTAGTTEDAEDHANEPVQQDLPQEAESARNTLDRDAQAQSAKEKEAARLAELEKQPNQSPQKPADKKGWLRNNLDRFKKGQQIADGPKEASSPAGQPQAQPNTPEQKTRVQEVKEHAKDKVEQEAKKKAEKAVEKKVAQSVVKEAVAGALEFLAPYIGIFLAILIGLVALGLLIYGIYTYVNGSKGGGANRLPTTQAQKDQATLLAGISGDTKANAQSVTNQANAIKTQLTGLKTRAAQTYPAAKAAAFNTQADTIAATADKLIANAGNLNSRKTLTTQLNQQISALSAAYPEIVANSATCAALSTYIASGALKFNHAITRQDIVSGYDINSANQKVPVSPYVCNIIGWIVQQGHSITVSTVANGHSQNVSAANSSNPSTSQHFVGEALDISVIDGSGSGSSDWVKKSTDLQQLLFNNYKGLAIHQLIGPAANLLILSEKSTVPTNPAGHSSLLANHTNHIHIGVVHQ